MEQKKQICISNELATLCSKYPWLIAYNLDPKEDDTGDQIFFVAHDPMPRFRCQIPELVGRVIRGCFHGWMILSELNQEDSYIEWSLWNPVISKLIRLPRLILKDEDVDDFRYCCLSSPPDDPGSILLLMRSTKPNIVFFNCERRKKSRGWTEMSYSKQMKNITDGYAYDDDDHDHDDDHYLVQPTCCNGNIYACSCGSTLPLLIQIQISVVKKKQVVINLLPLIKLPMPDWQLRIKNYFFMKGSGTQLFTIMLCVDNNKPSDVCLFNLDMISMVWTEIKDLKDTVLFLSMAEDDLLYSSPLITSELGGGYIHILGDTEEAIHSYNIKDKIISMHSLDLPLCDIFVWPTMPEYRLPKCKDGDHDDHMVLVTSATDTTMNDDDDDDDDEMKNEACILNTSLFDVLEAIMKFCVGISIWPNMPEFRLPKCKDGDHDDQMVLVTSATTIDTSTNDDDEMKDGACALNTLPLDVLEKIMKFCVGIEYLNFRATSKLCRLAAPMIQWSNEKMRLQTYSLVSPWLMVIDKNQRIMTFTDPMFGERKYFIKASSELFYDNRILCSGYGWLLLYIADHCLAFFNPFTSDLIRNLPPLCGIDSCTFSAPPTSPDCMVVAFQSYPCSTDVWFHRVGGKGEPLWFGISFDFGGNPHDFGFPVFCGEDIYTLFNGEGLEVFRDIDGHNNYSRKTIITPKTSTSAEYYQVKCDEHHLLVMVEAHGESVEVFKLNNRKREWEKIDGLGSHMIYICDTSCLCMEAKTTEMENKIYFARLHCNNDKMVFYSLETRRFHTFNGRNVEQNTLTNLFETKRTAYAHAWIQPTWS